MFRALYIIYALLLLIYLGAANHYGWVMWDTLAPSVERPGSTQHK